MPGEVIYTEKEFREYQQQLYRKKVRTQLERVFATYNRHKDLLLDDVVSKMVGSGSDAQPKAPNFDNKSERLMLEKLSAEEYVMFIDRLMGELDDLSFDIIELVYVDGSVTNEEIYSNILDMSHRDYYRKKWAAESKMYKKIRKNYPFLKSWH